jgi:hypothetical protein
MLRPLKAHVQEMAALLSQGADSPEELAEEVLKLAERLQGEREVWAVVFELSPGLYSGFGPYATQHMAVKSIPKLPIAQIAKRGVVVPIKGPAYADVQFAKAAEPCAEKGDFRLVREDAELFRKGWKGNTKNRAEYVA